MEKQNVSDIEMSPPPFRVKVVYTIPAMDELKRRFPSYVNPAYEGIVFKLIKACEMVSRETQEVEFEYVHIGRDVSDDTALTEIDRLGFRPALPEEGLAFDAKYHEEAKKYPIVFRGAEAGVDGKRLVAYAWHDGIGRCLDLGGVVSDWLDGCRFLVVRK